MNATRAQELTDRFPASFEEFRDLWAAEETQEGLIGLMQRVILRLLNTLVVMLADSRERRLAEALAGDVTPPAAPKGAGGKKAPARGSCCAHCSYGRDTVSIGGAGREAGQRRGGAIRRRPQAVAGRSPARFATRFHRDRRRPRLRKSGFAARVLLCLFRYRIATTLRGSVRQAAQCRPHMA
jgi:hypothetical protein